MELMPDDVYESDTDRLIRHMQEERYERTRRIIQQAIENAWEPEY